MMSNVSARSLCGFLNSTDKLPIIISLPRSSSTALYKSIAQQLDIAPKLRLFEYFNPDMHYRFTGHRIQFRWFNQQKADRMAIPQLEQVVGRAALLRAREDAYYVKLIINHFSFLSRGNKFAASEISKTIEWLCDRYAPILLYSRDVMQQTLSLVSALNTGKFTSINSRDLTHANIDEKAIERNANAMLDFLTLLDDLKERGLPHLLVERQAVFDLTNSEAAHDASIAATPYLLHEDKRALVYETLHATLGNGAHKERFRFGAGRVEMIP